MNESGRETQPESETHPLWILLLVVVLCCVGWYAIGQFVEMCQGWAMLFPMPSP